MSKVKLVVCEGYGSRENPRIGGTEKVIDLNLEVAETHDITGVIRYDFDANETGEKRSNDNLDPVIRYERINNLVGMVLTIVEAAIPDPEQRKAAKDLVKQACWNWYSAERDNLVEVWRLDKFPNYKDAFVTEK